MRAERATRLRYGRQKADICAAVLDIHTLYQTQTHTPRAQSTTSSMDARNMNSMLSLCYAACP